MGKKLYPEAFQGKISKKNYYEGWYNKIVNKNADKIMAFIPTIALNQASKSSHAFIQIMNGFTGETNYIKFDLEEFENLSSSDFKIRIGNNFFSTSGFNLDFARNGLTIKGVIRYRNPILWPKTVLQPGIMGILTYIPLLETYHGIISMNHSLRGSLNINGEEIIFNEGKGYLEKDWGSSFPKAYIWAQTNHFSNYELSFIFSLAQVPILGIPIKGFFCVIWHEGTFYKFTTYTGAKVRYIKLNNKNIKLVIEDKLYRLFIVISKQESTFSKLKAPSFGKMSYDIIESINSTIKIKLLDKRINKLIIEDEGVCAGLDLSNINMLY